LFSGQSHLGLRAIIPRRCFIRLRFRGLEQSIRIIKLRIPGM